LFENQFKVSQKLRGKTFVHFIEGGEVKKEYIVDK